jgi:lysophospholipase L1-like esterase
VVPEFNKAIGKAADGQKVRFVDFGLKFLAEDKSIPKPLMPDGLHLAAPGYEIYAKNLAPVVYAILKPK